MDSKEVLDFFKNSLQELDYPGVNAFEDEQYAEVFHSSNKIFLLSWLLIKICPWYKEMLEEAPNKEEMIEQLIYEEGFLPAGKRADFLRGKLDLADQVRLYLSMFQHLKYTSGDDVDAATVQDLSVDDIINDMKKKNLNLFQRFGEISILTEEEKKRLENHQMELEKSRNEKLKSHGDHKQVELKQSHPEEYLKLLDTFKKQLVAVRTEVLKKNAGRKTKNVYGIPPEAAELVESCAANLRKINQYKENMQSLSKFLKEDRLLEIGDGSTSGSMDKEMANDIRILKELLHELVK